MGAGEGKQRAKFWVVQRRRPAEGVVRRRVVWRRVVQGSPNQQPPQQHQHRQKWRVEDKTQNKCGPKGSGPLSPGFRGLGLWGFGFRSQCRSLGFGLFGSRNFGQNTKTLKLAKVGLAKVGQAHNWPKSVKELAKVDLAKVGWAKVGRDRKTTSSLNCARHCAQHTNKKTECTMDQVDALFLCTKDSILLAHPALLSNSQLRSKYTKSAASGTREHLSRHGL